MLKKTITYVDYDGKERVEEHLFNINKAELMEMELTTEGGYNEMLRRISKEENVPKLFTTFKGLVLKSYGEKSPDGKYFLKEDENGRPLCKKFEQSGAYNKLLEELVSNANAASDFVKGILPADVDK